MSRPKRRFRQVVVVGGYFKPEAKELVGKGGGEGEVHQPRRTVLSILCRLALEIDGLIYFFFLSFTKHKAHLTSR